MADHVAWCTACRAWRTIPGPGWDRRCPACGFWCSTLRCTRCGHEWTPRGWSGRLPKNCPACKSYLWSRTRTRGESP